jgi:hypothetical protein
MYTRLRPTSQAQFPDSASNGRLLRRYYTSPETHSRLGFIDILRIVLNSGCPIFRKQGEREFKIRRAR